MEAVGFDYYIQLLEQTIRELKGEAVEEVKSEIHLKVDIQIPEDYLPQMNLRLNLYKRISSAESLDEIQGIEEEVRDRFGPLPPSLLNLCQVGRIKFLAQKLKIQAVDRVDDRLVLKFLPSTAVAAPADDRPPQPVRRDADPPGRHEPGASRPATTRTSSVKRSPS